jgi:hypothetical protein
MRVDGASAVESVLNRTRRIRLRGLLPWDLGGGVIRRSDLGWISLFLRRRVRCWCRFRWGGRKGLAVSNVCVSPIPYKREIFDIADIVVKNWLKPIFRISA